MTDAKRRVFFYVQHLLGVGHLVRASRVAKALAEDGFEVMLVLGGIGVPGIDVGSATVVRLPPVRAGEGGFHALVHSDGRPFDEAAQADRRAALCGHFDRFAPDILIVEAFPFGRRQMRFELLPLLEMARSRPNPPLIATSVRDILQANRRPERIAETLDHIDRFFDLVVVHGDPRLARLEDSFAEAARFAEKVVYTGLVAPPPVAQAAARSPFSVIVSAGGGAVGAPLLEAALRARPHTRLADKPWLLLTGPNMPLPMRDRLDGLASPGVVLEPFVPDLARLLGGADLSISQAGYNTVADLLVSGCRSVLVPYATGGETEQDTRALRLDNLGLVVRLGETDVTPATLTAAIDRALDRGHVAHGLDLDGAARTATVLREWMRRSPADPDGPLRQPAAG